MTSRARVDAVAGRSEEWQAARGVLVAITAGTGGMLTAFDLANGAVPLAIVPTIALVVGARLSWHDRTVGWAGAAIWMTILPRAHGEGLLAPLAMVVAWVAVAVGPDRLGDWLRAEWTGRERAAERAEQRGWIEDDLSVR